MFDFHLAKNRASELSLENLQHTRIMGYFCGLCINSVRLRKFVLMKDSGYALSGFPARHAVRFRMRCH